MNTLMKVGLGLAVIGAGAVTVHVVQAAPVPAIAAADTLVMPKALEAHIRAMARAHAAEAGVPPATAEEHVMKMLHAHFTEVAKDPALVAQANQVMAAAAAGDKDALAHVEAMLGELMHGGAAAHH